eukprot:Opistho-2@36914
MGNSLGYSYMGKKDAAGRVSGVGSRGVGCLLGSHGLARNRSLLAHGRKDRHQEVLARLKLLLDLIANLALGKAEVALGLTGVVHQVQEARVDVDQLVILAADVGDVHVVSRRGQILVLLASEDVNGNQVDLGVAVLAGLRGAHLNNPAGAVLDDHKPVLAQRRALHRERLGRSRIGIIELLVFHFRQKTLLVEPLRPNITTAKSPCTLR